MRRKSIVVVGGGISGLAAAHRLCELSRARSMPCDVTLLEAQPRCGGVIETESRDGFLLEGGPDAFLSEKPWALGLCKRLGLESQIIQTQDRFRRSFIVKRGRLIRVPEGLYLIIPLQLAPLLKSPLLSCAGKMRIAAEVAIPPRGDPADESVAHFLRRRFGSEAYDWIGQPMIGGIYTADLEQLSMEATLPTFLELEKQYGSVTRGFRRRSNEMDASLGKASGPRYSLFVTLQGGLGTLIERLIQSIPEVFLRINAPVVHIRKEDGWTIVLRDGHILYADLLCLALPAPQAAVLLNSVAPDLAHDLEQIPYESVATVQFGFSRKEIGHPLDGFGFVVPAAERRSLVGCTFSSVKFPDRAPDDALLLRAFVGGVLHRQLVELDDEELVRRVFRDLQDLLKIQALPRFVSIRRYPRAMAYYPLGHLGRVASIEEKLARDPTLYLTGNGYRGIGIPECIHQAETVAERMWGMYEV